MDIEKKEETREEAEKENEEEAGEESEEAREEAGERARRPWKMEKPMEIRKNSLLEKLEDYGKSVFIHFICQAIKDRIF